MNEPIQIIIEAARIYNVDPRSLTKRHAGTADNDIKCAKRYIACKIWWLTGPILDDISKLLGTTRETISEWIDIELNHSQQHGKRAAQTITP